MDGETGSDAGVAGGERVGGRARVGDADGSGGAFASSVARRT